jgi:parallel beta-helix repeat protein
MVYPPQGFPTAAAAAPAKPLEATVFVAASDARSEVKALADFVCTGTNDDATIEQAFAALPAAGGKVKLSEGTFTFNSSLDILKSNVTLEGSGPGTKIFLANGANTSVIVVGNGATALSNIKICNLLIDGNKTNQTAPSMGILFYGTSGYLITNSVIENVWVKNCYGNGIHLQYGNNNIVTGNNCQSNGYEGIYIYYSNNNTVTGNNCQSNGYEGIRLEYGNNNTVTGNNCQSNGYEGILLYYGNNNTVTGNNCQSNSYHGIDLEYGNNNTVTGNNCQSNTIHGIFLDYSNNNTVTGNNCQSNGKVGIKLTSSNNNTITGNVSKDNSQQTNNSYDDIYVYGSSNYNIISSNIMIATATNKTRYAVNEDGSDYNIVTGNYCSGQVTGKIKLVGLNSIAANNIEV